MIFLSFFIFASLSAEPQIETLRRNDITPKIEPLIAYINQIYRAPPYLYDGEDEEYRSYLHSYTQDKNAVIHFVTDNNKIVGVAIGTPLAHSRDLYKQPFKNVDTLYYIGEFGLNEAYQGKGIENKLVQLLEKEAKDKGYGKIAIWELSNPKKLPSSALLPNEFWEKEGFIRHPELSFQINWTNIGDVNESPHTATYLIKEL